MTSCDYCHGHGHFDGCPYCGQTPDPMVAAHATNRDRARTRARLNTGAIHWATAPRTPRACPAGDRYCPCQDGDACHHQADTIHQLTGWVLDGYGEAA